MPDLLFKIKADNADAVEAIRELQSEVQRISQGLAQAVRQGAQSNQTFAASFGQVRAAIAQIAQGDAAGGIQ